MIKQIFIWLIALSLLMAAANTYAQWKKIKNFGEAVVCVHFLESANSPEIGFVGTAGNTLLNNHLWKTTNSGIDWQPINYPKNSFGRYSIPYCFTFKDINEGWFSEFFTSNNTLHRTTDGGLNWQELPDISCYSTYYNSLSRRLFTTAYGVSYYYSLDGTTFTPVTISGSDPTIGIAFSDGYHGIITPGKVTPITSKILYTSDGGLTWLQSNRLGEQYQPIGLKGSTTFFAISENDAYNNAKAGTLIRSDDGGISWREVYQYSDKRDFYSVTGTLQYNSNGIYFQTVEDNSGGIMMSVDSGSSFYSLCGPTNTSDTRFFARDSFIYAGDKYGGLWLNSTGIGSNSTPILSKSIVALQAQSCSDIFDTVTFTLFDSCNGRQATLLEASLNGSIKFSLNSGLIPRSIHPDDTLAIQYKPTSDLAEDTAIIHLRFKLGWKEFDTSITLIGKGYKAKDFTTTFFNPDTVYSNTITCANDSAVIRFRVQDTCRNLFATATKGNISGSSAFVLPPQLPKQSAGDDSLVVTFSPLRFGLDTSMLHVTFELDGVNVDTTFVLIGEYRPSKLSLAPSVSDTSLSVTSSNCIGASGHIYYWVFDSCLGIKGELVSATVTGSTNFQVTADADSAIVIYNGAGYDTAKLALKFRIYEYEYDTVITLYGYPSATKDSLSFIATLTKPSVTWEETTELRVSPDKAAANKGLAEIRFDVTLDADVLEPLTNYSTGITGASIVMGSATPVGKLTRYPFVITGNNMTLDPAVSILNLPMRPYVSDTTMTTIELSSFMLNGFDPDYERCTLSATGDGTPFTLALMCGDSLLSRYLGGKPILTITSLKPNPTKADVTVTFDLARSGSVKAEVLDVLGNVVKEETLEATQGETKYNISLPDATEGVYYVRLRFAGETRTVKFVRE